MAAGTDRRGSWRKQWSRPRDGATSHGFFRLPGYVTDLVIGWVDGRAEPVVEDAAPGLVRVDAANGYAQVALADGRDRRMAEGPFAGYCRPHHPQLAPLGGALD